MSRVNFLHPDYGRVRRSSLASDCRRMLVVVTVLLPACILVLSFMFWRSSHDGLAQVRDNHAEMLAELGKLDTQAERRDFATAMRLMEIREPWPAEDVMALLINVCGSGTLLDTLEIRLPIPTPEQSKSGRLIVGRQQGRNRDSQDGTFRLSGWSPSDDLVTAMAHELGRSDAISSVSIDECRPDKLGNTRFQISGSIVADPTKNHE